MEQQTEMKKERKKILIIGGICLLLIVAIAGYTYSYFVVKDTDTTTITGTVASGDLSIEINQLLPSTAYRTEGLIPQTDGAIENAIVGTTIDGTLQGCVDGNENAICQVFEISVTNDSNTDVVLDGLLRLNANQNPNLKWALIDGYTSEMQTEPTLMTPIKKHQITTMTANEEYIANETKTYHLVIWISETGEEQNDTGDFNGSITYKVSETSAASETLYALGIAPNVETPNFANTSCSNGCDESTVGVYSLEDDLGTSYYFRGDVVDNYVYFADLYWRIVRINGDGTIRIAYDGTKAFENEEEGERAVVAGFYNSQYEDNSFVGYMNGTIDGTYFDEGKTKTHSETYNYDELNPELAVARANNYNSTIKTFLEGAQNETNSGWYYDNIESKGYGSYIADAIYCNDRELNSGVGFGQNTTRYKIMANIGNATPKIEFKCENELDRFTKETMIKDVAGNTKLKYPIALLTLEELIAAGINYQKSNTKTYLSNVYKNRNTDGTLVRYQAVTMTPSIYNNGIGIGAYNAKAGTLTPLGYVETACYKPVISLSSDVLLYSDGKNGTEVSNGSKETPFIIKTQ